MSDERPLYERDPAAFNAWLAEGNATQARKRVGADVLARDSEGRILLVDPKYKPDWDLPGGMAEENEPPAVAAIREVREELNLQLEQVQLLAVDWVPPHGPWDDSLMFVFDGGVISPQRGAELRPVDDELHGFAFCTEHEAAERLRAYTWRRVQAALEALRTRRVAYLHHGESAPRTRVT